MQPAKPTSQQRKTAAVAQRAAVTEASEGQGFVEIAILSLAGLTLSVVMIAQGLMPQASLLVQ
jgi:hypothetical protein